MKVLKFYQYEKIEFLFEEIKMNLVTICQRAIMICQKKSIRFGMDILKNHFMIKKGKTRRTWVGFNTIIGGYIVISKAPIKEEIKASKEMVTCPICEGTVLNHHKPLIFGNSDIREIINQQVDEVLKLVGDLPELHKLKSIVGGDMRLTEDVSLLPRKAQVALKCLS